MKTRRSTMLATTFAVCIALNYALLKVYETKKANQEQHKKLQILKDMQQGYDEMRIKTMEKYGRNKMGQRL